MCFQYTMPPLPSRSHGMGSREKYRASPWTLVTTLVAVRVATSSGVARILSVATWTSGSMRNGRTSFSMCPDVTRGSSPWMFTYRVWEVAQGRAADVYVNIQGDEPLVTSGHIEKLVRPFLIEPEVQVATLKIRATPEEVATRTATKVVTNVHGDALYFSRLPIPCDRDGKGGIVYWKHIGLYAYRRACLETFHRLPPSRLEQAEQLEQLRLLEAGIPIRVLETDEQTIGVDTEDDLRAVEAVLLSRRR